MISSEAPNAKANWEEEMIALETQLNASVRMQIENTRDGIRRLGGSQERLQGGIGNKVTQTIALCKDSEGLVANYATIKQVSRVFNNFRLVNAVYDQFTALDETVDRAAALLQADIDGGDSENLLLVFHQLSKLEAFRHQTLGLMKDAPSATMYVLRRHFKKLDDLSAVFEAFFWAIPGDLFSLAVQGKQRVIVRVLKVVSRMKDRAAATDRLLGILGEAVKERFETAASMANVKPAEDIEGALQSVGFWLADLSTIRSGIVPCFPPEMCILDFYIQAYHRHVHRVLEMCVNLPAGARHQAGDVLFILRWVKDYHDKMTLDLGFLPEDLDCPLLNERQEARLIGEYLEVSRAKIAEWISNLYEGERSAFVERPAEPDVDANNCYLSPAAVDLIQIIKQNITTTAESSRGKLVLEIIAEVCRSVGDLQHKLGALLEAEATRFIAATEKQPEALRPHFEAYLVMVGNTGLRWATSLQAEIIEGLEGLVATEYLANATRQLKVLADGFISLAKMASACLCRIIIHSVNPAIQQLFTAPAWYSQPPPCETILLTFADFLQDYREHAEDFLFNKLAADVLEAFLVAYLRQLRAKPTKLRSDAAQALLESDLASITDYFCSLRDSKRVSKALEPLEKLIRLITASPKMVYLEFFAFWKVFPDISLAFLEEILAKRDDLDKPTLKEIMETCRKKTQEERPADIPPSIFAKLS